MMIVRVIMTLKPGIIVLCLGPGPRPGPGCASFSLTGFQLEGYRYSWRWREGGIGSVAIFATAIDAVTNCISNLLGDCTATKLSSSCGVKPRHSWSTLVDAEAWAVYDGATGELGTKQHLSISGDPPSFMTSEGVYYSPTVQRSPSRSPSSSRGATATSPETVTPSPSRSPTPTSASHWQAQSPSPSPSQAPTQVGTPSPSASGSGTSTPGPVLTVDIQLGVLAGVRTAH